MGILGAWTVSLASVANRKGEESPDDGPKRTIKSMKTEINDSSSKGADPRKSLVWPGSGDPSKQAILQNLDGLCLCMRVYKCAHTDANFQDEADHHQAVRQRPSAPPHTALTPKYTQEVIHGLSHVSSISSR